jgi:hypothetical protein
MGGRALDNIFVERLWRTLKYEEVYLHDYEQVEDAVQSLGNYFWFYNHELPHQALAYQTPAAMYFEEKNARKGSETGDARGHASSRSSLLGLPDAKFSPGDPAFQKVPSVVRRTG